MTALTPDYEAAIRERLNAATEGPWAVDDDDPEYIVSPEKGGYDGLAIAKVVDQDEGLFPIEHNGQFIANAPTDLADLLAELDRLRGKLADAWDEGAEYAWAETCEGFNGEYTDEAGTHDGKASFKSQMPEINNPYRKDQS